MLGQLVAARLLTSWEMPIADGAGEGVAAAPAPGRHRIEIVHESLLRSWLRLVRWQAQDAEGSLLRDQLKQAAHLWEEKSRSPDLLWSGTSFREYELWRERYQGRLTALEEEYAKAMVERAQRRRRLRRGAVAAAFLVLAGVSAAIAVSRQQATKARDQARAEALRAEANRLVTLAQLRLADDPTEALAYATASLEVSDTPEARVFVMKALWEAPPSFTLPVGPPPQRAPAFSPDGTTLAAGGHDPTELLWSDRGGAPTPLEGNEISPRGSNAAGWSADGHLVTGLCCGLATRAHVWSAEGKRLRTIEFGAPTRWQVGKEHVFGTTEEGRRGEPRAAAAVVAAAGRRGEHRSAAFPGALVGPPAPTAFLPDATGFAYVRDRTLFVRSLAAGTVGEARLVGRHGADIDWLGADAGTWDRLLSHDKSGETRIWTAAPGRLELERVIPRPATAPSAAGAANERWVLGDTWADKMLRAWDLEALPGSRPLNLRRSGSWNLAGTDAHPRGDWLTVFQISEGRAAFWPLRKRYPSVVDGYELSRPVAFSPDGRWLATSWAGGQLRLWSTPGAGIREPRTLELPEAVPWTSIAFDPRGRYLFVVGNSDRAWIVPLDGSRPRRLPVYSEDTSVGAAAVSPSGRQVAWAWGYGLGPKTLRVHDVETGETRVFPLPTDAASQRSAVSGVAYQGMVEGMGFIDETTLYTSGWAGLRRWDLKRGTSALVAADVDFLGFLGADRRLALTGVPVAGRDAAKCQRLETRDLVAGTTTPLGASGACLTEWSGAAASGEITAAPGPDGVLVGRLSGDAAHLLVGHEGPVSGVAVSPDGRWVATSGQDNTLRLWPMPDLAQPPLHALPHDELLAKLKSLTNLRVVRDPKSPAGWKIDIAPFPGWKDVPTW